MELISKDCERVEAEEEIDDDHDDKEEEVDDEEEEEEGVTLEEVTEEVEEEQEADVEEGIDLVKFVGTVVVVVMAASLPEGFATTAVAV